MLKYFKNIYLVILVIFVIWMLFGDSNSWLIHNELNNEIENIEDEKKYYKKEIEKDIKAMKKLNNEEGIEKLAREEYYMKKENEDIYIIEYEDSLKTKSNE